MAKNDTTQLSRTYTAEAAAAGGQRRQTICFFAPIGGKGDLVVAFWGVFFSPHLAGSESKTLEKKPL